MTDQNHTSVSIRVDTHVWNSLSDANRSEICREALRSHAQARVDSAQLFEYIDGYEEAKEDLREAEDRVEFTRFKLFKELNSSIYSDVLDRGELYEGMTVFEQSIIYAARYAESCSFESTDEVVTSVMREMHSDGYNIDEGVVEWIVDEVKSDI